jgi:hypothetical protein
MPLISVTNIAIFHAEVSSSIVTVKKNRLPGWYRVHSWKEYRINLNGATPGPYDNIVFCNFLDILIWI